MTHSFRACYFHWIWSTLKRRPLITPTIRDKLYNYMAGIITKHDGHLLKIGGTDNHVHLLIQLNNPDLFSKCLQNTKASSSLWVHKNFPQEHQFAWQEGHGSFSVSYSSLDSVSAYIQNQEKHHLKIPFEQEYLAVLKKHNISYDPRFVLG